MAEGVNECLHLLVLIEEVRGEMARTETDHVMDGTDHT